MTFINYNFNYYNTLKITFVFLLFAFILKSLFKTPSVIIEFVLLSLLLVFSLIYASQYLRINRVSSGVFLLFLIYILLHTLSAIFFRPFIFDIPFISALQFSLLEFRLSTISYFLPLVFIPLIKINHEKFENFLFIIIKLSIGFTIAEQILSLIGMRGFFETFYSTSGVVSDNQIGAKSLGLYRIWGVVGSPQLLGVFHLFTLVYMLHKRNRFWTLLSIISVILSTSKTAYIILLIVGILYLLYNKRYLLLFVLSLLATFMIFFIFNMYYTLIENMSDEYPKFQKFIGSILGYLTLLFNVREVSAPEAFIPGGALYILYDYYSENILQIFLGKGLTYSFMQDNLISSSDLGSFLYLTSDFYILTFFDQYGLFGIILLIYLFGIYPLHKLLSDGNYLHIVPIIFLLSMFHYPPHLPKIMMLLASYPLFKIYLYDKK